MLRTLGCAFLLVIAPAFAACAATAAAITPAAAPIEETGPSRPDAWPPLELLGAIIPPGASHQLDFRGEDDFIAYLVAFRGAQPGPTLCVTAGVHGDELNGVAIARQLIEETDPAELRGTLLVVPIVNAHGFRNASRYLPDRRDLNRHFPGRRNGSLAGRIAYQFFEQVVRRCDGLVDLHTGSLRRTNLAQIRTDLRDVANLRIAWGFGSEHVVHSVGREGTLRRAANDVGIPSVLYEAGEPGVIDAREIEMGVAGIRTLLAALQMREGEPPPPAEQRLYGETQWVRADASGIYVPTVRPGDAVAAGQALATITDPFSKERASVVAPTAGRVLGMALGQVVIPGFALFHLGIEATAPDVAAAGEGDLAPHEPAGDDDPLRAEFGEERPE